MKPKAEKKGRGAARPEPAPPYVHPFDRLYGTDTGGLIPGCDLWTGHTHDRHITAYYGTAPSILEGLLDRWSQTIPLGTLDRWCFVDFGAGKGRVVMLAALQPFREVVGIERHPELAAIARANLLRYTAGAEPLAPARIVEADVLAAELPPAPLLAFLFHPFEAPLLRSLLRRLETHAAQTAAPALDLLYVNAEHTLVLENAKGWKRLFHGSVAMSAEDHLADLKEIEDQVQYGSTGDEICGIYRWQPKP